MIKFMKVKEWWHDLWFPLRNWISYGQIEFLEHQVKSAKDGADYFKSELAISEEKFRRWFKKDSIEFARIEAERKTMLAVNPEKVIKVEEIIVEEAGKPMRKRILTVGDMQLTPELTKILKEETAYVKRTMWWDLCQNTLTETARRTMFENSKDFDDVKTGKALLYAIDILKKITDKILE